MLHLKEREPRTSANVQGSEGDLAWRLDLPNEYPATRHSATREESDSYAHIIARLNPKWRVIRCRDGIQWILQYRRGQRDGAPAWRNRSFCTTSGSIVRCAHEHAGLVDASTLDVLRALPGHIRDGGRS